MGYELRKVVIYITLDRHGDERQQRDDRLCDELLEEIRRVVEQKKYEAISPSL